MTRALVPLVMTLVTTGCGSSVDTNPRDGYLGVYVTTSATSMNAPPWFELVEGPTGGIEAFPCDSQTTCDIAGEDIFLDAFDTEPLELQLSEHDAFSGTETQTMVQGCEGTSRGACVSRFFGAVLSRTSSGSVQLEYCYTQFPAPTCQQTAPTSCPPVIETPNEIFPECDAGPDEIVGALSN